MSHNYVTRTLLNFSYGQNLAFLKYHISFKQKKFNALASYELDKQVPISSIQRHIIIIGIYILQNLDDRIILCVFQPIEGKEVYYNNIMPWITIIYVCPLM